MLGIDKELYLEMEERVLEKHNEVLEKIIDRIEVSIGTVNITELMYYIKKDVEILYNLDESLNQLKS